MYCDAATRPASITAALIQPPWVVCKPKSPNTTRLPRVASPFIRPLWLFRCLTLLGISAIAGLLVHALIDPHLNPDVALRGGRLGKAVVDLRPQGGQRHRAAGLLFPARHFGASQTAGQLNLDALGPGLHRGFRGALHGAAEAGAFAQLLGDVFGHQLGEDLRAIDFFDLDVDPPP